MQKVCTYSIVYPNNVKNLIIIEYSMWKIILEVPIRSFECILPGHSDKKHLKKREIRQYKDVRALKVII